MKSLISITVVLVLTACGGGGGDQASVTETSKPLETTSGGSLSAPPSLGIDSRNIVGSDPSNNYFAYAGVAGERLVLHVNLSVPLSDTQEARCASEPGTGATPSNYATQIHVYDSNHVRLGGICGEDLTYTFPGTGPFILDFEFPSDPGFIDAASLKGDNPISFLETGSGSPTEPKKLNVATANSIGTDVFFNYYWISAVKGQTIVVGVALNQPLTNQQKSRCGSNPDAYQTQIIVYDSKLNKVGLSCGESLTLEVPESGNYVLQFNYGSQSAGTFAGQTI